MSNSLKMADCVNDICPWSGKPVSADSLMLYRGKVIGFCNTNCRDRFKKAAEFFEPLLT